MKKSESNFYVKRHTTDKLLERIQYWNNDKEIQISKSIVSRTNIRVGAILDDGLCEALMYEANIMLLTPENYKTVIKYGCLDIIIIESTWSTVTGHWYMGQYKNSIEQPALIEILRMAEEKRIPSVFWITKDNLYHEHYKDFALNFDYVFCFDRLIVEKLKSEGVNASHLPVCVQPKIYDGIDCMPEKEITMLFDGWVDIDKYPERYLNLRTLFESGLRIIESRYQIFNSRRKLIENEFKGILGSVSRSGKIKLLLASKTYLTLSATVSTKTTQQYMTFEAIAAKVPVVHCGDIAESDARFGLVKSIKETEISDFLKDPSNVLNLKAPAMPYENTIEYSTKLIFTAAL